MASESGKWGWDGDGLRDGETLVGELIGMGVREDKWILTVENEVKRLEVIRGISVVRNGFINGFSVENGAGDRSEIKPEENMDIMEKKRMKVKRSGNNGRRKDTK